MEGGDAAKLASQGSIENPPQAMDNANHPKNPVQCGEHELLSRDGAWNFEKMRYQP